MQKAAKRREAIAEIHELGGIVNYYDVDNCFTNGEPPGWFSWLRRLHGDEHLGNAVRVNLQGRQVTDAGLEHLKGLTKLERLDLGDTRITDAGLEHLN